MVKLKSVLQSVFPKWDPSTCNETLYLRDVAGWDSMNSVNLSLELETAFGIDLSGIVFSGEQTISDVVRMLRENGASMSER
jgi:acyl carrier protein